MNEAGGDPAWFTTRGPLAGDVCEPEMESSPVTRSTESLTSDSPPSRTVGSDFLLFSCSVHGILSS